MKATIFRGIFFIKSLTFVPFHSIAIYFWPFLILYRDKQNFSVFYCTVSPLGDICKYFAIVKWKVICQISQIFKNDKFNDKPCIYCIPYSTISIGIPFSCGKVRETITAVISPPQGLSKLQLVSNKLSICPLF